jgi:hypothetical protein
MKIRIATESLPQESVGTGAAAVAGLMLRASRAVEEGDRTPSAVTPATPVNCAKRCAAALSR